MKKRSIIDFIQWSGQIGVLAYRHPENNISKYAKLQVNEAQEAIVVVNGTKSQKFGPGQYNLDSPNVPILREFFGVPFGGVNPWTVQIWFVNKLKPRDVQWRIDNFPVYDAAFQAQIPIGVSGTYGITVEDAERLVFQLALGFPYSGDGAQEITVDDFTEQLRGELTVKSKSLISKAFQANGYSVNQISAHLSDISSVLQPDLESFFDDYGCSLSKFYVTSIDVDTTTEYGRSVQEAISQQTAQKISGHTWQQSKMFETAQEAMRNSQGGGILGAVMMTGMMGGLGGGGGSAMAGGLMAPKYDQPTPTTGNAPAGGAPSQPQPAVREVFCSNCSRKYTTDKKFCPYCGDAYNPCPNCGADVDANATRCSTCGVSLSGQAAPTCPNCHAATVPGAAFCSNCGAPLSEDKCPRCGTPTRGMAFCPNCGLKISK